MSTEFALSLLRAAWGNGENFVISPFSLGAALAIVRDGAKGQTQEELASLLKDNPNLALDASEVSSLHPSFTTVVFVDKSTIIHSAAKRACIDEEFALKSEYQSQIQKEFNVEPEIIDCEESAKRVNSFVIDKAGRTIPDLLSDNALDNAVAMIITTVNFKGEWETPFDKGLTEKRTFYGIAGDRETVFMRAPMLNTSYSLTDELTAVSLAYKNSSLVFIMPSGDFSEWMDNLTAEQLKATIKNLHSSTINLELPKFNIESTTAGREVLQKLGVNKIFEQDADLSGISDQPVSVAKVVHKAVFEISEEGTEATADAKAVVEKRADMTVEKDVRFDRPFLYVLFKENAVVFIGVHV